MVDTGDVTDRRSVIVTLEDRFERTAVPGELLRETRLIAGPTKRALDDQFDAPRRM